jgi:murein DD-endopeptidase MepM/ murein hydrolase activator NlpD
VLLSVRLQILSIAFDRAKNLIGSDYPTVKRLFDRHYTVLLADRANGLVRRFTLSLRPAMITLAILASLPILMGLGAKWSARYEIAQLRQANSDLQIENASYRTATGELTSQIQSLEGVIDDLGARANLDPNAARAMAKLPAAVRQRASGGPVASTPPSGMSSASSVFATSLSSPEDTFGALRDLLQGLENRLNFVKRDVERREQLANATPSIWPTHGGLTGFFGGRSDPFSGEPEYHTGIDIAAAKGQPVYATADGVVQAASYTGDYGNLVVVKHAFGLTTRYGHLSAYHVKIGDKVTRGDVVGYIGSTGRSTGAHLHYEILVNGQLMNPLQLLTSQAR